MATDSFGSAADHGGLSGLTVGDPHPQYLAVAGGGTISASGAAVKPLVLKLAANATANALEVQSSTGTALSSVRYDGAVFSPAYVPASKPGDTFGSFIGWANVPGDGVAVIGNNTVKTVLTVRPTSGTQTANLQEWQSNTGAVLSNVNANGRGIFSGANITNANYGDNSVNLFVQSNIATDRQLLVRGAASQTANLAEFQNSAGTVLSNVSPAGWINAPTLNAGAAANDGSVALFSTASSATQRGLLVRGAASQTANLAEFQNNAGAVLASVTSLGRYVQGPVIGAEMDITIPTNNTGLVVKGASNQGANLIECRNSANTTVFGVKPDGQLSLVPSTITTATAGGGQATPANVALFYSITLTNGVSYRIPLYNP